MATKSPIEVLFLIYPTFNTLDLNGPLDILRNAFLRSDSGISPLKSDAFAITVAAASPLTTSYEGVAIQRSVSFSHASETLSKYDILFQIGGLSKGISPHLNPNDEIILLIQKFSRLGYSHRLGDLRIMVSICTGALFFGYAGIFAGLDATTHFMSLGDLKTICQEYNTRAPGSKVTKVVPDPSDPAFRYVKVQVNPGATARVISSGGISCGLDATLYLVAYLFGRDLAIGTAGVMQYAWREMGTTEPWQPAITLPQDHYLHPEAPAEWWWHIGTLTVQDPVIGAERTLGFEINAVGATDDGHDGDAANFSQIMLTDVKNGKHYQATQVFPGNANWAESDPSKPWFATLGVDGSNGALHMAATSADVSTRTVRASFTDSATATPITFNLTMHQSVPPLLVFGTGVLLNADPHGTTPLTKNNYYYSLTDLQTSGVVTIGKEKLNVVGITWMDHQYGAWSFKLRWSLQSAILDNGYRLMSFSPTNTVIAENQPYVSNVTILFPDGTNQYTSGVTTPRGPLFVSTEGVTYFTVVDLHIKDVDASLRFTSCLPDQEFKGSSPVYEGIAKATGTWGGAKVEGTAWIEQSLSKTTASNVIGGRAAPLGLALSTRK